MTIDELIDALSETDQPSDMNIKVIIALLGSDHPVWKTHVGTAMKFANVTTSLDQARSLFFVAFPGWCYRVAECCVSDDAWVTPDFNHPEHGESLQRLYPEECQRDPIEWFGSDVDLRPPGRPAQAFFLSMLIARKKVLKWRAQREEYMRALGEIQ